MRSVSKHVNGKLSIHVLAAIIAEAVCFGGWVGGASSEEHDLQDEVSLLQHAKIDQVASHRAWHSPDPYRHPMTPRRSFSGNHDTIQAWIRGLVADRGESTEAWIKAHKKKQEEGEDESEDAAKRRARRSISSTLRRRRTRMSWKRKRRREKMKARMQQRRWARRRREKMKARMQQKKAGSKEHIVNLEKKEDEDELEEEEEEGEDESEDAAKKAGSKEHIVNLEEREEKREARVKAGSAISYGGSGTEGDCPARERTAPPHQRHLQAVKVLKHCSDDDDGTASGWPKFNTPAELKQSPWGKYFLAVYGEIPERKESYPICTSALSHLYTPMLTAANVHLPEMTTHCPSSTGQYYSIMIQQQKVWSTWIWNFNLAQPLASSANGLPAEHWVEILHEPPTKGVGSGGKLETNASWMYYTPGTGIWFNLGTTKVFDNHGDAMTNLLGEPCRDSWNECDEGDQFDRLYKAARKAGLNSLQFLKHTDMTCDEDGLQAQGGHSKNTAIEIVNLAGKGDNPCEFADGATTGKTYRAGWEARYECICDNSWGSKGMMNCKGFGCMAS